MEAITNANELKQIIEAACSNPSHALISALQDVTPKQHRYEVIFLVLGRDWSIGRDMVKEQSKFLLEKAKA